MMAKKEATVIIHSLLLIGTIVFVFILIQTASSFSPQFVALIFLLYLLIKAVGKNLSRELEAIVMTFLVLFFVSSTNNLASPFFFLIYFLLFGLSLLLEPIIPLVLSLSLIVYFLLLSNSTSPLNFIPLFSLPFITPLAVFLGQEHLKARKSEEEQKDEEEATLLWLTTIFYKHLEEILEAAESLHSDVLTQVQKENLNKLKRMTRRLEILGRRLKKAIED